MVSSDSRTRGTPTPTPVYLVGTGGRHRLAPGLVDGPSSMTQEDRETERISIACMIGAAPLVSTVTRYGLSENLHVHVPVGTPPVNMPLPVWPSISPATTRKKHQKAQGRLSVSATHRDDLRDSLQIKALGRRGRWKTGRTNRDVER